MLITLNMQIPYYALESQITLILFFEKGGGLSVFLVYMFISSEATL